MTMGETAQRWKRYLSPCFLAGKVREKGIVHCLLMGTLLLFQFILTRALRYPLYLMGVRFLQIGVHAIGHLAVEPDCYVKEGILGMRPQHHFEIVLAPANRVANHHLLGYWRKHIRFISSPLLCYLLTPLSQDSRLQFDTIRYANVVNQTADYPVIQRAYADRSPVLSLSEFDRERGWENLSKLGVPEDAWFVCVHCREPGYTPDQIFHNYRDADVHDYLPAIRAIVKRGGWCIRMGDPTMKPLPPMEHVIDYVHHAIKSDWMDIFLCASCTFLIGCNSGLYGVASVFGVPAAVANLAPMSVVLPYGYRDIGIPKLVWSSREGRLLTFKEVLDSPIGNFRYTHLYDEAAVKVVDNSPEDIRDLALEMLDRVEGKAIYTAEDERLQERFKSLLKRGHYSYGSSSRVGRDFLRKYVSLLPDDHEISQN